MCSMSVGTLNTRLFYDWDVDGFFLSFWCDYGRGDRSRWNFECMQVDPTKLVCGLILRFCGISVGEIGGVRKFLLSF